MLDAGRTQEEVKHWLGHKYISSTDVYAAISNRKQKEVHRHLERAREIVHIWFVYEDTGGVGES